MAADVLQAILSDVSGQITGLGLGPPCVVRKGPKKEPVTDAAPQFTVSMQAAGEKKKYIAFGHVVTIWPIEITMISASKRDYLYNFANYTAYRQAIEAIWNPPVAFGTLFPATPGVFDARLKPNEMLPRGEIAEGVDRWTIVLEVSTAV